MQIRDMKQRSVNVHDFSMIPKAEIPRSQFRMQKNLKTTFSFSYWSRSSSKKSYRAITGDRTHHRRPHTCGDRAGDG